MIIEDKCIPANEAFSAEVLENIKTEGEHLAHLYIAELFFQITEIRNGRENLKQVQSITNERKK